MAAQSLGTLSVALVDNSASRAYSDQVKGLIAQCPRDRGFGLSYTAAACNGGFGVGNNSVLSTLQSDCHLILNPDVELADSTLDVALERLAQDSSIVLLSPRVAADSGTQEFLCKRYPSVLVLLLRAFAPGAAAPGAAAPGAIAGLFRRRLNRYEMRDVCAGTEETPVLLASGCFMLVRTAALRAVGGFDERYFLYFEDFDLSLRLAKYGRLVFSPAVTIVHHGGYAASKGGRHVVMFVKSGIRFFASHGWRWI